MTPSRGPLAASGAAPTSPPTRRWLVLVLVSFAVGATRGFFYAPGAGVGLQRATRQRGYYSSSRPRRSATSPFLQPFALREPPARGGVCRMAEDEGETAAAAAAAASDGGGAQKESEEGADVKPATEEEKLVEATGDKPAASEEKAVVEEPKAAEIDEEETVEAKVEEKAVEEDKPVVPEAEDSAAAAAVEEEQVSEVAEDTPVEAEEAGGKAVEAEEEKPVVAEKEEAAAAAEEKEATVVAAEDEEEAPVAEEDTPMAEQETPAAGEEKTVVAEAEEETPEVEEEKPAVPEMEEEQTDVQEEKTAVAEEEKADVEEEKPAVVAEVEEETAEAKEEEPVVVVEEEEEEEEKDVEPEEEKPVVAEEKPVETDKETVPESEATAAAAEEETEKEESKADSKPEMPELLNPTREELESAFPNPPRAPYPTLPDPRKMTAKQLEAAASQDVSYGGQPAARRANIDFERSERERIHFETATRVMNYEIQAQRSEAAAAASAEIDEELSPEEARKLRRAALRDDFYGLIEVTDDDEGIRADYKWDQKPELITFSAFGVLFNWHLPVGLIMREALGRAHHYVHRMPPPGAFEKHFRNSHEEASFHIPCYGAHENISTWEWWFHVFADAYLKTINEFYMDEDIVLTKIDDIVDELYYEIMVGPEAFEVMPLVKVVLDRLAAWRDNDGGPKLAVVADDDDRLHVVLENMGLLPYFDFVLTSRETGCELKETKMYEMAMETAEVKLPQKALHVGAKYETDITGSCEAGMEAVCVKRMQSLYERPNEPYEFHRVYEIGELLNRLGLPEADEEYMGRRRGNYWEEMEDEDDEEFLDEFYSTEDDAGMALFEGGQ